MNQTESMERERFEEEHINRVLSDIIIFPGNKKEFEELVGYECYIINLQGNFEGVTYCAKNVYHTPFKQYGKELFKCGIVGLIHATPVSLFQLGDSPLYSYYGLPIGRKK